ncbi:hypothetical protein [Sphingobacterium athyrii]|uniref:hypothetical protein n=1 Tax=Sphingobacterium athyrii TaxID=2152717 RepID=UPI0015E83A04|nr:hypothetical protein [Sphingobacterium athyrii]
MSKEQNKKEVKVLRVAIPLPAKDYGINTGSRKIPSFIPFPFAYAITRCPD